MAQIKVTYAKLIETADTISTATQEFTGIMAEVRSDMVSLAGKWESDAADAFRQQFDRLAVNFDAYEKVLNDYAAYLNKSASEYSTQDSKIMDQTSVLDGSALFV